MRTNPRLRKQPRLSRIDDGRVWYLLLQIGVPSPSHRYGEDPSHHIQVVQNDLRALGGILIRRVSLKYGKQSYANGLYLFTFSRHRRDDAAATRLAEAFFYGMSLVHGPTAESHDSLFIRVPDIMVYRARSIRLEDLVALEQSRACEDRALLYPIATIGTVSSTTSERHEAAWKVAAVTFNNAALFDATRFLKRSHDNFLVSPGQICEVASDTNAVPRTASQQTDFEDALQNAFKAVEAIIGDPPKDDRKLFDKLRNIGIDPLEEVGYGEKVAISAMIRKMSAARDKRSAHGSTRQRTIRPAELLEFQACAEVIILGALEKDRGAALFA